MAITVLLGSDYDDQSSCVTEALEDDALDQREKKKRYFHLLRRFITSRRLQENRGF